MGMKLCKQHKSPSLGHGLNQRCEAALAPPIPGFCADLRFSLNYPHAVIVPHFGNYVRVKQMNLFE